MKKMDAIKIIEELVENAINDCDYCLIRKAMDIAGNEGILMCEDEDCVMVEDDVFYFNGAF